MEQLNASDQGQKQTFQRKIAFKHQKLFQASAKIRQASSDF